MDDTLRFSAADRRKDRRGRLYHGRRRYPRLPLEVDWFLEAKDFSAVGRGVEVSLRGARLPLAIPPQWTGTLHLHLALPGRARLFKAAVIPVTGVSQRGFILRFQGVPPAELALLTQALIDRHGFAAVPALDRRFRRFTPLHRRFLAST